MKILKKLIDKTKENFRIKLILCFLLCAVIPILCIGMISYMISFRISKNKVIESVQLSCRQDARMLDSRMHQVEKLADSIHFQLFNLYNTPEQPLTTYLNRFSDVQTNLSSMADSFQLYQISVFLDDSTFAARDGVNYFPLSEMSRYQISFDDFSNLGVSPKWLFRNHIDFPYLVTGGTAPEGTFSCYRIAVVNAKYYVFGIHLTSEELSDYLIESSGKYPIHSYFIDENGTIVSSSQPSEIGNKLSDEQKKLYLKQTSSHSLHANKKEILVHPIHNHNLYLVNEIPDRYILKNTSILVDFILLTLLVVIAATLIAILFVSNQLTQKINRLSCAMAQIPENVSTDFTKIASLIPINKSHPDEIDQLVLSCDTMLQELYYSHKNVLDLHITEERLNYQLLQSQINPHFLYNILASVQTLLSIDELTKANRMLSDLSLFYRGLLRNSDTLIPIRKELEIAELYMDMETLCKNNAFDWDIHLDEGIEHFLICKFTLQPILENSIQHGLTGSSSKMHIHIDIRYDDDMIVIELSDNGTGISDDKLKEIQKDLEEKNVQYDKHFGLSNINSRIHSSLQGHGTLEISNHTDGGTKVCIRIPQILEE